MVYGEDDGCESNLSDWVVIIVIECSVGAESCSCFVREVCV